MEKIKVFIDQQQQQQKDKLLGNVEQEKEHICLKKSTDLSWNISFMAY